MVTTHPATRASPSLHCRYGKSHRVEPRPRDDRHLARIRANRDDVRGMGTLMSNPDVCLTMIMQVPGIGTGVGGGVWTALQGGSALTVLGATAVTGGIAAAAGALSAGYICGG